MSSSQWTIQYQHHIDKVQPGDRKGRNPLEGYARACGIQYGNARELCQQDPDYQRAFDLARNCTLVLETRLMNIFLLFKFFLHRLETGAIVEFGSYMGGSAIFMASLAARFLGRTQVYGFDTFSGIPDSNSAIDLHRAGEFKEAKLPAIREYAARAGLTNLHFIEGTFEQTIPRTIRDIGPIRLMHIDCDVGSSVGYCYESCKAHMVPGGYIVLDDPLTSTCLGAFEAMEELMIRQDQLHAEQAFPHMVFRASPPEPRTMQATQAQRLAEQGT